MSKIVEIIPEQNWQLIRNRIANILIDEFGYQYLKTYDPELQPEIVLENQGPTDKVDLPLINVLLINGNYDAKFYNGSIKGVYQFGVDCYTNAKTTKAVAGSSTASLRLQRLIGVCRYILEHTAYKMLGFNPGFITGVWCSNIQIADMNKDDALNTMMGRLTFNVGCAETTDLIKPTIAAGYDTVVKIENTNNIGYKYQTENYL